MSGIFTGHILARGRPARHGTRLSRTATLALLTAVALLAACAPATATTDPATPTPAGTPTRTRPPTVVYRADWSQGLSAWNATSGWSLVNGAPQTDMGQDRTLSVPYQPAVSDYAVEYTMTILEPHDDGECDFTSPPVAGSDGYELRLYNLLSPGHVQFALHPQFGINIVPIDSQNNPAPWVDFEPGTKPHMYRIEIHGPLAVVYVDGHRISPSAESTVTPTLSNGPFTFSCSLTEIRLSSLTISTL